ncbi:hypothetical protein VSR68_30470 [Paraburkholderia phymatum]|uniref:hypothetical protein n=1 Tax=Paraburkholderia phymatum TaxID=148447 RepID=UPI0031716B3E
MNQPDGRRSMFDLSTIPIKSIASALIAIGTAWKGVISWRRRRNTAASDSKRRALTNAEQLEAYARVVWDLIVSNHQGWLMSAPTRSGYRYEFELPALADGLSTGDGAGDVRLEATWRGLQQLVGDANRHVDEVYFSDFGGPEEALAVLERRAYPVADRALALARRYRRQFVLPPRELGKRERDIAQDIRDEAIVKSGRPSVLNLPARIRYSLAVRRCSQDTPQLPIYRSRWRALKRRLKRSLRRASTTSREEQ